MSRFDDCLAFTLDQEGGFTNDPHDPGGATNMGITLATLTSWRGQPCTPDDVAALSRDEAGAIYRDRYWNRMQCDSLSPGLDLMVFDFGVNAGPAVSARLLQQALGVDADGMIGPHTLLAAKGCDRAAVVADLARRQRAYYAGLSGYPRFGRGWVARTDRRVAAAMGVVA